MIMNQRFVAIWFLHLKTDWMIRQNPPLKNIPFVMAAPAHGRMMITEASTMAKAKGICNGMVVSDARIILPGIQVIDDTKDVGARLIKKLSLWCARYSPAVAIDNPDGLLLDVSGCAHLWGTERDYLKDIIHKLKAFGYHIRAAIADTIGAAWAIARYGKTTAIIKQDDHGTAMSGLPPAALRLPVDITERLHKLGFYTIGSFMHIPRSMLRRRFGNPLLQRLDEALGHIEEALLPVIPVTPYQERLPCLEPITTKTGIEIALENLIVLLCKRLRKESKGLRKASFKGYRIDNKTEQINIVTNHPSNNPQHLFKLFELKIGTIEPALGIELFLLEALQIEDVVPVQETFWTANNSMESKETAELLDSLQSKFGNNIIHRYLPAEHHLPERSTRQADALKDKPAIPWRTDKIRPIQLFKQPIEIRVTAPIPDYPPMNFRYKGKLHTIKKADACERIEAEWWMDDGLHRDYYGVEDEEGRRFWIFRLGHYDEEKKPQWFIHGFFA